MTEPEHKVNSHWRYLWLIPGVVLFLWGAQLSWLQWRVTTWPQLPCTVEAFDPGLASTRNGSGYHANPNVKFRYAVADQTFQGTKLSPSPFNYFLESTFQRDTGHLRIGHPATCWYNPKKPQQAYLTNTGITACGVIAAGFGLLLAFMMLVTITPIRLDFGWLKITPGEQKPDRFKSE
jgi:hypothetical protein